jgi:hypothetical protein
MFALRSGTMGDHPTGDRQSTGMMKTHPSLGDRDDFDS